jgi:hypothetical protein
VLSLTAWAIGLAAPPATASALFLPASEGSAEATVSSVAWTLHAFWTTLVALLAYAWIYSYFWTTAATVYLLMRKEVDGIPLDTISYQRRPNPLFDLTTTTGSETSTPTAAQTPSPHAASAPDSTSAMARGTEENSGAVD